MSHSLIHLLERINETKNLNSKIDDLKVKTRL